MNTTAPRFARAHAPWYAHRWPWLLMAGPAVVLVAGAFTTWLALSRPDALVAGDYYQRGKAINQDLRRDRAAGTLKLALRAHYDPASGKLEGQLTSHGLALKAPFRLLLTHPTLPNRDRALLVIPGAEGRFSVALPALEQTHWQVVLEGGRRDWRLAQSWEWPRQASLDIDAAPLL